MGYPDKLGQIVRHLLAVLAATGIIFTAAIVQAAPADIREIGVLVSGTSMDTDRGPGSPNLRMVVDHTLNLGITKGNFKQPGQPPVDSVIVYDLERLVIKGHYPVPDEYGSIRIELAEVDVLRHRVIFPQNNEDPGRAGCPGGVASDAAGIVTFDLKDHDFRRIPMPCTSVSRATNLALPEGEVQADQFYLLGASLDPKTRKIYALGSPQGEVSVRAIPTRHKEYQTPILLRQVDEMTGSLDWEVDLRPLGCDNMMDENHAPFVGRHGSNVFSYCYGPKDGAEARPGYAIWVPLDTNQMPLVEDQRRRVVRRTPALPNALFPLMDPVSGRMLFLTTADQGNGDAVWVYDGVNERFFGVIASGASPTANPVTTMGGFDPVRGRAYLLTSAGLLVADARHNPLPAGLAFPVLQDVRRQQAGLYIATAPNLRRVFIPVKGRGFVVLEDNVPEPPPPPVTDPDSGTADIAEVPGKTGSVYSAGGAAFGMHVIVTGGLPRIVNNLDPFCVGTVSTLVSDKDSLGRCTADQLVTSGNRELFLAASGVELGSETGAAAEAAGAAFSTKDTATDADFKRLGNCQRELVQDKTGISLDPQGSNGDRLEPGATYADLCNGKNLPAHVKAGPNGEVYQPIPRFSIFDGGTRGRDGRGFPVPSSSCQDFGSGKSEQRQIPTNDGMPWHSVGASSVSCDATLASSQGSSQFAGFSWPQPNDPVVSLFRAESETRNRLTPRGTLTEVEATAHGLKLFGEVSIGRIYTKATSLAHGRTGTAETDFQRKISDVHGLGFDCDELTDNPEDPCSLQKFVSQFNQTFGAKMRLSLPAAEQVKTPKGYQSIVIKDEASRESDRAVNDDDTYAVPGLQLVIYNDGYQGRSRMILKLAGVQSESRYGIFLLPEEAAFADEVLSAGGFDLDGIEQLFEGLAPPGIAEKVRRVLEKGIQYPVSLVRDGFKLLVNDPDQFGVLFVMWALLASPIYLAIRRVSFGRSIAS